MLHTRTAPASKQWMTGPGAKRIGPLQRSYHVVPKCHVSISSGQSGYAVMQAIELPRRLGGLSPVQGDKPAVFATAQPYTTAHLYGLGVCSAEFLISYPHQCRSFSRKTTKRMGAIAACDLYRESWDSIEYNFIFGHASIWHGSRKNARTDIG